MDTNNFQRLGSKSNAHVGSDFEADARAFFAGQGISLTPDHCVSVGVDKIKKSRKFDLGSEFPPVLVECKSHTWTKGDNTPSAKITVWNEAMFYFHLAPTKYRKILFVLRDFSAKKGVTLAGYYLRTFGHLIPEGVEVWEYEPEINKAKRIH